MPFLCCFMKDWWKDIWVVIGQGSHDFDYVIILTMIWIPKWSTLCCLWQHSQGHFVFCRLLRIDFLINQLYHDLWKTSSIAVLLLLLLLEIPCRWFQGGHASVRICHGNFSKNCHTSLPPKLFCSDDHNDIGALWPLEPHPC